MEGRREEMDFDDSDLFDDSDHDPDFNIVEFRKRNIGNCSDSEEEEFEREKERKKKKIRTEIFTKTASSDPTPSNSQDESEYRGEDEDEEVEEEEKKEGSASDQEENTNYNRVKMKCVAMIKKMMDKAKGQKRTALKNSLENLMKQETPQQVSEI